VVIGALAAAGLAANRLELEITESVLMQNSDATLATLHQLRELGVSISMDDFGTGYSSLSYLRSFPFDKIKIDRCFISGLAAGDDSVAIVLAIAGLAKNLGMATTAEGVETKQQLQQVKALGCSEMQGFLFSPPRRMEDLMPLFRSRLEKELVAEVRRRA
jgi:EAL domain-containing protein (putative c-di-GMP-specific phosphodiesterase class I)